MNDQTHASAGGGGHPLLRRRDGHHAKVCFEELFFDLVYVFAVTQLSAKLLNNLTLFGVAETLVLWFAVWLGWQYTCWATNWCDPTRPRMRIVLFATMGLALVMAAAIPQAFGQMGLVFALTYTCAQVGRTAFIVHQLEHDHPLSANYRRILGWLLISAVFWIAGGFAEGSWRLGLWSLAILCEYLSPMIGFRLPGLGRSTSRDWTIEGGHLAERCQLFVIVALGEGLLAIGATLSKAPSWDAGILTATLFTFIGTLALWWLYFGTSSEDATAAITRSDDPGRMGARLHYAHVILVAGIIATAVGNDLALAHAFDKAKLPYALVLTIGPAVFLAGSLLYRHVVYGSWAVSHWAGMAALGGLLAVAGAMTILPLAVLVVMVLLAVGFHEGRRVRPASRHRPASR